MQSPFKRIIVYDLETGGLQWKYNQITEVAAVVIDTETLEVVEEFTLMLKPRLDLSHREEEPLKEAKLIFNALASKDAETNVKTLQYGSEGITLKTLEGMAEDIKAFYIFLKEYGNIFTYEQYLDLLDTEFGDIAKVYFDRTYNPEALAVTHMSIKMLVEGGVEYNEFTGAFEELIERHTVGNSKPIIAGHNIKGFDNDFIVRMLLDSKVDLWKKVNPFMIDTLEWARMRWFELPSFSLGVCANAIGLTLKEAHRALADTQANAKFLIKMLQNLRGEGSQESTYKRRKYKFNF